MSDAKKPTLDGRVALVTGAGRGLGRAYVKALAAHGAKVVVNNRSPESAATAVAEIEQAGGEAVAVGADLESPGTAEQVVAAALDTFGRLDIVVNNAGGADAPQVPFVETSTDTRDALMRQNFITAWDVTQAAWPHLVSGGYGRIVLTASPITLYGAPGFTPYAAAKGAVVGLARTLAVEGAEHGITVNVLNPLASTTSDPPDSDFRRWYNETFQVEHVATALSWLVDERCTATGEIFALGGRRVARLAITEGTGYVAPAPLADADALATNFDAVLSDTDSKEFAALGDYFGFVTGLHQ